METREQALAIFHAALSAASPERMLRELEPPTPGANGRLLVLGAGKAAAHLARAAERRLDGREYGGVVIVKYGHGLPLERIEVLEGGHPIPDEGSLQATSRLLSRLEGLGEADRVWFLLTGGASALLVAPEEGLTLDDKARTTELLLRGGATIQEINAVRKHLSRVKGGRLLQAMAPARVTTLVVSDVIGDDLSSIGSGPTAPDPTTFRDALDVLERYGASAAAPPAVLDHLRRGAQGDVEETPKPGDPTLARVEHRILGSNRGALDAAARQAESLGYRVEIFARDMVGDVHERAVAFCRALSSLPPGTALLAGGELTLTVTGLGRGGRSQELAMVASRELAGREGLLVLAAGTDGTDGPTDAAGAIADGASWNASREKGVDPEALLADNDSYRFFDALGSLVKTGPTGTNVNDLVVGLVPSG